MPIGLSQRSVRLQGILVNDPRHGAVRPGERRQEERVRLRQPEDDGLRVRGFDGLHLRAAATIEFGKAAPFRLRVRVAFPVPRHVCRGHAGTVVKLQARAKPEGIAPPVLRNGKRLREERLNARILAIGDETLDDVQDHRISVVVAIDAWIRATNVRIQRDAKRGLLSQSRQRRRDQQSRDTPCQQGFGLQSHHHPPGFPVIPALYSLRCAAVDRRFQTAFA